MNGKHLRRGVPCPHSLNWWLKRLQRLPANGRIVLCTSLVDMRKSFDSLAAMVCNAFLMQPLSGELFVFLNANSDFMKLLWWDTGGFCILAKRLEQGRFRLPKASADGGPIQVDRAVLAMIFDGIEVSNVKRLKRELLV